MQQFLGRRYELDVIRLEPGEEPYLPPEGTALRLLEIPIGDELMFFFELARRGGRGTAMMGIQRGSGENIDTYRRHTILANHIGKVADAMDIAADLIQRDDKEQRGRQRRGDR